MLEAWNERRNAIVQPDFAFLDKHYHARRRRNNLGQRCEVEDGVEGHWFQRRNDRPLTDCGLVQRVLALRDQHDRARQLPIGDGIADHRLNRVEL